MTGERDPRVTAVAEVIDRLDGIDPLDRLRARLTPPAGEQ